MSIGGLQELFKEFYLKNKTGQIDKKKFFDNFLTTLNINFDELDGKIVSKDCEGIQNEIKYHKFA